MYAPPLIVVLVRVIVSLSIAAAIVAAVIVPPNDVSAPAIVIPSFANFAFAIEPASIALVTEVFAIVNAPADKVASPDTVVHERSPFVKISSHKK